MILLASQIPAHKAVLDVSAIVEKVALQAIPGIEGMLDLVALETVEAVVAGIGVEAKDDVRRILAAEVPISVIQVFAPQKRPDKVAILRFPYVVAPIAVRVLRAGLVGMRDGIPQFLELLEERSGEIIIPAIGKRIPSVGNPFRPVVNREPYALSECRDDGFSRKRRFCFSEFPEYPERQEPLPDAKRALARMWNIELFEYRDIFRLDYEPSVARCAGFRFRGHAISAQKHLRQ